MRRRVPPGLLLGVLALLVAATSAACAGTKASEARSRRVDLLTTACAARDFTSCDELAGEVGAPATAREFGATCGGLRAAPAGSCSELITATTTPGPSAGSGCIGEGARGNAVRDLQQRLNAAGADPPLVVDGEFGPLTAQAVQDALGKTTYCETERDRLERQQAEFVTVPDVRRQPEADAVAVLSAIEMNTATVERCSDVVDTGTVVAVSYEREDGTILTVFDAEAPVNSETTLIPPHVLVQLAVAQGPCDDAAVAG